MAAEAMFFHMVQLNDVWQAPTWSSIEHGGRWKLLHYKAKSFYAPCLVTGRVKDGTIEVHGVNDTTHTLNARMHIEVQNLYIWYLVENSPLPLSWLLPSMHWLLCLSSVQMFMPRRYSEDLCAAVPTWCHRSALVPLLKTVRALQFIAWDAKLGPSLSINVPTRLEPGSSKVVWSKSIERLLIACSGEVNDCCVRVTCHATIARPQTFAGLSTVLPEPFATLSRRNARPEYSVRAFYRLPSSSELHVSRSSPSENGVADESYSSETVVFLSEMKDATLSEAAIQVGGRAIKQTVPGPLRWHRPLANLHGSNSMLAGLSVAGLDHHENCWEMLSIVQYLCDDISGRHGLGTCSCSHEPEMMQATPFVDILRSTY